MHQTSGVPMNQSPAWMDEIAKEELYRIDMLGLFPLLFTLVCCLLFLFPSFLLAKIGWNLTASYWQPFGAVMTLSLALVPLIIVGAHVIHARKMVPVKKVVIFGIFVPATIIILMADMFYESSWRKAQDLADRDCDAFQGKRDLQNSWEVAYYIYESCLNQTNVVSGYTRAQLQKNFRLDDCEDYSMISDEYQAYKYDWLYLEHLEKSLACSGWCYPGQQLWSKQTVKDDCSSSVSNSFYYFVRARSMQILLTMTFTLIILAAGVVCISEPMKEAGFDW